MSFFYTDGLCAGYGAAPILNNISFSADSGMITGILGANGSGKTTLLKAVCGILPHTGTCHLCGTVLENLSPRNLSLLCSYIPQRSGISIDISVLDVVLMGFNPHLRLLEYPGAEMKEEAVKALHKVGLSGMDDTSYLHLSEGQKQLCILARTIVSDHKLLLLDEPESALDFHFRHKILDILKSWVAEKQSAAILSLHDPMLALNYCDKLILLSDSNICSVINPKTDSNSDMEQKLIPLYGKISLHTCGDNRGREHLVMLKESEEQ